MSNLQKVIGLIRELSNKTIDRGCTEAEAFSAMKKIDELLTVYNLSLDKVFLDSVECNGQKTFW